MVLGCGPENHFENQSQCDGEFDKFIRSKKLRKKIGKCTSSLTAMSDLTSEKIAKALKGAGLSSKQRIKKAVEAWENNAIFFPNKDDFLFEWICSAFAKPNMKK